MKRLAYCTLALAFLAIGYFNASCVKPNPDAVAYKRIVEELKTDGRIDPEELTISVKQGVAEINGEVGSRLHPQIIDDILEKLKEEGVIESYRNNVTVMEVENPLFQDYTAPLF